MKILPMLILLLPLSALAAAYRWVDKNGGVHYTQTPPASGEFSQLPSTSSPDPASPEPQQQSIEQYLQSAEQAESQKRQADVDAKTKATREEAVVQQCSAARERLRRLDASPPRRLMIENADGSQSRMTVEGWEQRRAETQKLIDASCK